MSNSDVLTLRKETADGCGDPFSPEEFSGFLPLSCGEAVFNFSLERIEYPESSGDEEEWDDYIDRTVTTLRPKDIGASIFTTRSLLSTNVHRTRPTTRPTTTRPTTTRPTTTRTTITSPATTHRTTSPRVGIVSFTLGRHAQRLPSPFTASPESRQNSLNFLIRLHLNRFNKRLSMLESNTLDMKENLQDIGGQQSKLSTQLTQLLTLHSALGKTERMSELEKSYSDMAARLSKLEGRLEILIDGFTALAQEMNKIKRSRHVSRSSQEKRALPVLPTVLGPTIRPQTKATVPRSLPVPKLYVNKAKPPPNNQGLKSTVTSKPSSQTVKPNTKPKPLNRVTKSLVTVTSMTKHKTTLSKAKPYFKPKVTTKPKPKATVQKKKPTVTAKNPSTIRLNKPRQTKSDVATTKYQLSPPSHKSRPSTEVVKHLPSSRSGAHAVNQDKRTGKKNSAIRSDAPDSKKITTNVQDKERTAKKQPKVVLQQASERQFPSTKEKGKQQSKTPAPTVYQLSPPSHKGSSISKPKANVKKGSTSTTTRPAKTSSSRNKSQSLKTSEKDKAKTTVTKKPQQKKKPQSQPNRDVFDILKLLRGQQQPKRKEQQGGALHIVLGRMAIPIKIIPDY